MKRFVVVNIICFAVMTMAFVGCMICGSVDIPVEEVISSIFEGEASRQAWHYIVVETRLPAAVTALLAGAALSVAGILLQTLFDNPLAGPSILGISTGASLGVAIVILAFGGLLSFWGQAAILAAAFLGATIVIVCLLALSSLIKSSTMLLIAGILIGYLTSSAIALLNFFASSETVQAYMVWGLGNFNTMTLGRLPLFAILVAIFLFSSFVFAKPLNAMLLGSRYAESSGINIKATRSWILLISGALTAIVTAWCGPIGFIGLTVPHIARLSLQSSNHRYVLPTTAVCGAATGVICQLLSVLPGQWGIIPINAITPIVGVPVIVYIIIRRRSISYFN